MYSTLYSYWQRCAHIMPCWQRQYTYSYTHSHPPWSPFYAYRTWMPNRPSWKRKSSACGQYISRILCRPKFYYLVHQSIPLVLILSQMNPLYCVPSYLFKIRLDIVFLFLQAVSFGQVSFPNPTYISILPRTFLNHLILSDCSTEYLVRNTNRNVPDNTVSFNLLLPFPS